MGLSGGAVITAVVTCAAGLIIGGLIGHFATKSNYEEKLSELNKKYVIKPLKNIDKKYVIKPLKSIDKQNREFLISQANAAEVEKVLIELTKEPHLAGSERNNHLGDWIEEKWKSYGFKTKQDIQDVLLSYPGGPGKRNKVQLLDAQSNTIIESQESEKPLVPEMNTSAIVPPFLAYTKAGIVQSTKVYYINYCRVEDFESIKKVLGVNLTDSIVICRYGMIFRANKIMLAQKNGALGVVIFNDPSDSVELDKVNPTYSETFPNSWYLPPSGAERGTAKLLSGDPLSEYVYRKTVNQIRKEEAIPNIPVQPIGYEDAQKFLSHLTGGEVPKDWKGGIRSLIYRYGGELTNQKSIKLINNNSEERKNISNVFGIIEGSLEPDRYVLIGNHRDAWMFGGTDPSSGTAVMMEISRMFYELMKTGWRPRRTIIFCSWDAEEYGLIGSIEWLEDVRVLVAERAVVYLNCDSGVVYPTYLSMRASPLLHNLIYETAKLIPHPNRPISLYDEWKEVKGDKRNPNAKPVIPDLGSGSDHHGFMHRHCITSAASVYIYDDSKTKIKTLYPLYHTVYDSFPNVKRFVDPTFTYHRALSQFLAEMLRSLSDSVIIPFVTTDYAKRLKDIQEDLERSLTATLAKKNLTNYLVDLREAILKLEKRSQEFDDKIKTLNTSSWPELRRRNDQLHLFERSFSFPLGVLNRSFIKHVVFAPSSTNSYASSAFSGIGDSLFQITDNDTVAWQRVEIELTKAIYSVESACKALQVDDLI